MRRSLILEGGASDALQNSGDVFDLVTKPRTVNGDKCGNRPSTMCDGNSGSNVLCKCSEECSMCDCDRFTSFSQCECQWLHPDIVRSHAMHEM
jgi:hypothetical protein